MVDNPAAVLSLHLQQHQDVQPEFVEEPSIFQELEQKMIHMEQPVDQQHEQGEQPFEVPMMDSDDNPVENVPADFKTFTTTNNNNNNNNYYVNFNGPNSASDDQANIFVDYPMVLRTSRGKILAELISSLANSKMIVQGFIEFRPDMWIIRSVEPGSRRLVIVKLMGKQFENYYCAHTFSMTINFVDLARRLKPLKTNGKQNLTLLVNRQAAMEIVIENPSNGSRLRLSLKQCQMDMYIVKLPPIEMPFNMEVPMNWFKEGIEMLSSFAAAKAIYALTFGFSAQSFYLKVEDDTCTIGSNTDQDSGAVDYQGHDFEKDFGISDLKLLLQVLDGNKQSDSVIFRTAPVGAILFDQMIGSLEEPLGLIRVIIGPYESGNDDQQEQIQAEQSDQPVDTNMSDL